MGFFLNSTGALTRFSVRLLLGPHLLALRMARTDIKGHYTFEPVPTGTYYLYAEYTTAFEKSAWAVKIQVNQNSTHDLSNHNMTGPFL